MGFSPTCLPVQVSQHRREFMWSCTALFQILRWGLGTEVFHEWRHSSETHTLLFPISIQVPSSPVFQAAVKSCIFVSIHALKQFILTFIQVKQRKNCLIRCQINIWFPCQGCSMTKPIKQTISISNNGAQKRFWRALFHVKKDKERGIYNCSDPCKTQSNLETKPAQNKSTAAAVTVLLFSTACAALPGESKHVAATSRELWARCFAPQHCKGKDMSGFQQGISRFALH